NFGSITGYQWKNTGGNIPGATNVTCTATATANYSVVVTNSGNCTTQSAASSVTANSNPTPSITETDNSGLANDDAIICNLDAVNLSANPASGVTYSWNLGLGTNQAVSDNPSANTTYTVTVMDVNNCTALATKAVTVNSLPPVAVSPASAV